MKYAWINEGANSGPVVGLNRGAQGGETEGSITPQELIYGMDNGMYKVVNGVFTPKDQSDIDEINWQRASDQKISEVWAYHDGTINGYGWADSVYQTKRGAKMGKAQRAEAKGTATPEQIQILDDNDALDTWLDDMESAAEVGVAFLEDTANTIEQIEAFNVETDIVWPPYPFV